VIKIPRREVFNDYTIREETTALILKQADGSTMETLIDTEDLDGLVKSKTPWHSQWCIRTQSYYATASRRFTDENGKRRGSTISLNRVVLGITDKKVFVDHINHDTLDNRKINLRTSTCSQNCRHRKGPNTNNKSGHRNVFWNTNIGKWSVRMFKDGRHISCGDFSDLETAAQIAKSMREKYYGEFAGLDSRYTIE
jgi:hypothetical protein